MLARLIQARSGHISYLDESRERTVVVRLVQARSGHSRERSVLARLIQARSGHISYVSESRKEVF